ncbi:MAG TPA: M28 family peptidase [Thermoanaerobaculia bacterium]|nr:M28 family peptidase [Thermoanaerobaculia bacterium]
MRAAALVLCALLARAPLGSAPPLLTERMREDLAALVVSAKATDGAYETIRELLEASGPRLTGSPGDALAVAWATRALEARGFSNVHTEPVTAKHWERGEESGELLLPIPLRLSLCALGGSVGTPDGGVEADVVEATSLEGVDALGEKAKGKIVLIWQVMERGPTGAGYGATVPIRTNGASRAAKVGAAAVLVRSVGTSSARFPHTGAVDYAEGVAPIPAAALAIPDADLLHRYLGAGRRVRVRLRLGARTLPDVKAANVIGEIPGRERPEEIVVVGGHHDSWDLGTGAMDDGAGCGISIEAARLVGRLPRRPRRTIRVVLFANEENGLAGGRAYAKEHAAELGRHVAAVEADAGAGRTSGFGWTAGPSAAPLVAELAAFLAPFGWGEARKGGGGADIGPMRAAGVPTFSPTQDVARYFDLHHSADDTFDKIDRDELKTAVATVAALLYTLAESETPPERIPEGERGSRRN